MGLRTSQLSWFECHPSSPKSKPTSCWNKLSPPSYNHNWTDLHYAASQGNLSKIKDIFLKSGTVNLNTRDYYGKTPLYWASYKGHRECISELLVMGAEVNIPCRHGGTPLHTVVSLYPECVALLIQYGADVNRSDHWGVTPMYLAATNAQLDVIRYLITAGAQLTYRNKKTGDIPKQLSSHTDFLEYLQSVERNPSSLQQITRLRIRQQLQDHPLDKIQQLPLPASLKDFLALQEIK